MPVDAVPESGAGDRSAAVWATEEWRARAVEWVDAELERIGARRTGTGDPSRVRAWSTVVRIPTTLGVMWFKAASHATTAEVALYGLLVDAVPSQVLHPIAADIPRGWLLLPDGGPSLGESLGGADAVAVLERVLPQYAALQLALTPRASELFAIGLDDMSPARMPSRFDEAAAAVQRAVVDTDREAYARVLAIRPRYEEWTRELAASPVPLSIDHNDLHVANILLPPEDPAAPARFYDWGDAVVAHPFASMLHGLGWVSPHLGVSEDGPQVRRLRDAYLSAFAGFGTHRELVHTLALACRVAKVGRCLSWARAIALGDAATGFERAPLELFLGVAERSYLSPV